MLGTVGLTAVAGCDVDDLRPPEEQPDPSSDPTQGALEPDEVLVEGAVAGIAETLALVKAARSLPPLRDRLRPLVGMHRKHLDVLGGAPTGPRPDAGGAESAYRLVRRREQQLQDQLAAWSVEASSGALARLFASMSAAVAQHLVALPQTLDDGGR